MLVAYGPEGQPIVAKDGNLAQLKDLSRRNLLICPNCRGKVHVRGGSEKRIQVHFAHQKGECSWSTEAESIRHLQGKIVLSEWLQKQFPSTRITLEKRLPEPNRIADIFVTFDDGRQWAIEFQCASLDIEEWHRRHKAYGEAGIRDIWILGSNRLEKQESFIEAIIISASEVMFVDPLLTPPIIWLRWSISRDTMLERQFVKGWTPSVEGWVGRSRWKYGATLKGILGDASLRADGHLTHPNRSTFEKQINILREMRKAQAIDKAFLKAYLEPIVGGEALDVILFPMLRAYQLDPDLLTRYNYGRGSGDYFISEADRRRLEQARDWLEWLAQREFSARWLERLSQAIPRVGPYSAFAIYMEMLALLSKSATDEQG
ncbi:MAG: competence protein CoiA [Ktedonobacteraceae bacterium]